MKKTKIIGTIGDKNNDVKTLEEMINLGVDVFRINLSYIDLDLCDTLIKNIRLASKNVKKIVGIMLDLDGPSIRIDKLIENEAYLELGDTIRIYNYHVVCNNTQISTNCNNLVELVNKSDIIIIGHGDVKLKVEEINSDNFVCEVVDAGFIKSNQVVHIKSSYMDLSFISSKDKESIMYAIKQDVDFLALSYVRDEQDVLSVIDMLIENENDHIGIISKIETEDAFLNIDEILKVSDGVMVSRGDLGINTEIEKLPYLQKEILKKANSYQKIGLVSTNFLKSMVKEKIPSRGEVTDIYNAVFDKADGLVLTDETTIGEHSLESITLMSKILSEAELHFDYKENLEDTLKHGKLDVTSTISYSVVDSGILLNASCILANTISGYTARKISYFRPMSPILGLSPDKKTLRSLTLNYGVTPVLIKKYDDSESIVTECVNKYKEITDYKIGDIVIITGGLPISTKNTDFMKIEKIVD
ncbi:MAG: pyruvate kinase [Bacilli bacterium]|nr:pyruvate kinase [Bacilli bacterium]